MEYKEFVDLVFKLANEEGFADYETYFSKGESFKVNIFEGSIENYSVSGSLGLGFRGIYNGKMGYSFTEILDNESALILVRSAKANASIIENEDTEIIYKGAADYQLFDTYSQELADVKTEERISLAFQMEKAALARDSRIKGLQACSTGYYSEEIRLSNSKGLDLNHTSNIMTAFVVPVVKDGEGMVTGSAYRVIRDFSGISPEELAKEAVDDAIAYIGAETVNSGKYKIVLKNEAATDLLETYSMIFSADRAQKGLSRLRGRKGERIGAAVLTIVDDPLMKDGLCSTPFDGEGVPAKTKEVVSDGVLKTLLYNLKTALKDGTETTANASRPSYAATVEISPSNFYIKPGTYTFGQILGQMEEGLYITELQGLHSGANAVSGDFSLSAKGFTVKEGKIERPVEQITLSGNFYKLLENIEAVGNDLKFGMPGSACFGSPCLLINELSVAGK